VSILTHGPLSPYWHDNRPATADRKKHVPYSAHGVLVERGAAHRGTKSSVENTKSSSSRNANSSVCMSWPSAWYVCVSVSSMVTPLSGVCQAAPTVHPSANRFRPVDTVRGTGC
jgi:hypothetical protein